MSYTTPVNAFHWTFTKRYVFWHPIRIIKWYFHTRKMAKQRAKQGWCEDDVTDWYNWSAYVLCGLLFDISESENMPPKRKGQLKKIAEDISSAILDDSEMVKCNEELQQVMRNTMILAEERDAAFKKHDEEVKRITEKRRRTTAEAFKELGTIFYDFWN